MADCEFALNSILDDLQPDPWQKAQGCREERAAGTALNIGVSLLEVAGVQARGSRILNLLGGPVTVGAGKIVDLETAVLLRSHMDL